VEIEITRHGLRIKPTNQPMDDIVIEEVLGLYKEGDYVKLVRVSNKPILLYVLETDPDICPVLAKTEAALTCEGTGEIMPSVDSAVEAARQTLKKGENRETQPKPLPCPFCGEYPEILTSEAADHTVISGKVVCVNPQCPAQPEVVDDRRLSDSINEEPFRSTLILQWNTRPANAG
jgi:hypothetical protein